MTGNQTMDYYVRPRHLYSHSRTCTRSGLCRRLSRLVASFICYLLDLPVLMRFQLSWLDSSICQTFPAIMEILIYCKSLVFMEIIILCISSLWRLWSMYVVCGDDHTSYIVSCLFMAIVLLCIQDCYIYLQLYVELYHCIVLIGWLVIPLGYS